MLNTNLYRGFDGYLEGEMHRKQRRLLNPVFAVSHIRELGESVFLMYRIVC